MSNQIVGDLYSQIINKIITACADDFASHAYSQEMLDDLKKSWQQNLSKMKVAQMPWDPVPINIATGPVGPAGSGAHEANAKAEAIKAEPRVKQESQPEVGLAQFPGQAGGLNPRAAERAVANLRRGYGQQANASILAAGLPQQPRVGLALPGQLPQSGGPPRAQGHSSHAQMDGGLSLDAWDEIMEDLRRDDGSRRPALDRILESTATDKLGEASSSAQPEHVHEATFISLTPVNLPTHLRKPNQLDGGDDSEIPDDEAINSDLDDPDDEDIQNIADDGYQGEMILCLWDKVNRVKSKWKCTLKDGILSTGGKEYLFQKATGDILEPDNPDSTDFVMTKREQRRVAALSRRTMRGDDAL